VLLRIAQRRLGQRGERLDSCLGRGQVELARPERFRQQWAPEAYPRGDVARIAGTDRHRMRSATAKATASPGW